MSEDRSHRPLVKRLGRPPAAESTAFERECPKHGLTIYHRYAEGRVRCKRCVGEAVTRRHQLIKRTLVEEAGGCCAICGYDRTVINLHFHHVDPALKSFSITTGKGRAIATYRAEALKCVLVCANCHGEIEAGLIPSPPAGTWFSGRPAPSVASAAGGELVEEQLDRPL